MPMELCNKINALYVHSNLYMKRDKYLLAAGAIVEQLQAQTARQKKAWNFTVFSTKFRLIKAWQKNCFPQQQSRERFDNNNFLAWKYEVNLSIKVNLIVEA